MSPVMQRVEQRISRFGRGISTGLGLDFVGSKYRNFAGHLGAVRNQALSLASSLTSVALIGAAAGTVLLKAFASSSEEITATANKLGLTTDALQGLRYAADSLGVEQGALDSSLTSFVKRLGELRAGTGSLLTGLEDLDPGFARIIASANGTDEALFMMLDRIAKFPDAAKRAALAAAAFGRSGSGLVNFFRDGPDALGDAIQRARDLGAVLGSEVLARGLLLDDAIDDLTARSKGLAYTVVAQLAPVLASLMEDFGADLDENREGILQWARDFADRLPGRIARFKLALKDLRAELSPVLDALKAGVQLVGGLGNALLIATAVMVGSFVASIVTATVALAGLAAAFVSNPIGLALTLIAAGAGYLAKQLYDLGLTADDVWLGIRLGVSRLVDDVIAAISDLTAGLPDWLKSWLGGSTAGGAMKFGIETAVANKLGGTTSTLAKEMAARAPEIEERRIAREKGGMAHVLLELGAGFPPGTRARTAADSDADVEIETKLGGALGAH